MQLVDKEYKITVKVIDKVNRSFYKQIPVIYGLTKDQVNAAKIIGWAWSDAIFTGEDKSHNQYVLIDINGNYRWWPAMFSGGYIQRFDNGVVGYYVESDDAGNTGKLIKIPQIYVV